jgi:RimJ/RimL family protein N-acetyltransferase
MQSERLIYKEVGEAHEGVFHALVTDSHVKAFLFDDETMTLEWTRQAIQDSKQLFERRNVGLWLVSERAGGDFIGFCGFRHFPRYGDEPELLYAFLKAAIGRGYATECALAMIAHAREVAGMKRIESAVDEPNVGSKRVLEKVGFQRTGTIPGAFGRIITYELFLDGD